MYWFTLKVASMDFSEKRQTNNGYKYLIVDLFLSDFTQAQALSAALRLSLIDLLAESGEINFDNLATQVEIDRQGLALLVKLLETNGVIKRENNVITLTPKFIEALVYRDLMEVKLECAKLAVHDFADFFPVFIKSPGEFFHRARIFKLFNYGMCFENTPENYQQTKQWMRLTTTLTRYESHVIMEYHNFSNFRKLLDIGGNSGEFALQICRRYPDIKAKVFDLPLVCQIGHEHIDRENEFERISFIEGNILEDILPKGFDIVTCKSMLHDWPEDAVKIIIRKATDSLDRGGSILIFERGPLEGNETVPYSFLPLFLFYHAYRSPDLYVQILEELDYKNITTQWINLETPFFLITAIKQ